MTWTGPVPNPPGKTSYQASVEHANGTSFNIEENAVGALPADVASSFESLMDLIAASPDWTLLYASRDLTGRETYTP
jgi:hypothetical protein